jgi:hypothetical protein
MASKLKTSQIAPHKTSVLLCQVSAAITVSFNVCKVSVAKFAIQQKCD